MYIPKFLIFGVKYLLSPPAKKTCPWTVSTEGCNGSEIVGFAEDNVALLHWAFSIPQTPIQRSSFLAFATRTFSPIKNPNLRFAGNFSVVSTLRRNTEPIVMKEALCAVDFGNYIQDRDRDLGRALEKMRGIFPDHI